MENEFFSVLSGTTLKKSLPDAIAEAEAFAKKNPSQEYFVVKAVKKVSLGIVQISDLGPSLAT